MKKLDYVDALRGWAILGVITIHTSQFGRVKMDPLTERMLLEGSRGVLLFFLASAFTLFLSYKRRIGKEIYPTRNFFLRRFFRIAPMFYIGIIYFFFQSWINTHSWINESTYITPSSIISSFFFLHAFSPFWIAGVVPGGWSIGVEMTFYLLLPIIAYRIKNLSDAFLFFLISLIFKAILFYFLLRFPLIEDQGLWVNFLFLYFPAQIPIFALGIMLYFVVIEKEDMLSISGSYLLFFFTLIIIQLVSKSQLLLADNILFGFAFFILGLALSKYRSPLFVNSTLIYIGKISFSLYLVHFAVIFWFNKYDLLDYVSNPYMNYAIRLLAITSASAAVSTLTYHIVEVPFQNIGNKIIASLENLNQNIHQS